MRTYAAQYDGKCGKESCGAEIVVKDLISFPPEGRGKPVCKGCTGEALDAGDVSVWDAMSGMSMNEVGTTGRAGLDARESELEAAMVMPRGRSRADMCGSCFQIPSASGVCSC